MLWLQDRSVRALGYWASAYLIGGFAVASWSVTPDILPAAWTDLASALLFTCCGLIWSGARKFHGREASFGGVIAGAVVWLVITRMPELMQWDNARARAVFADHHDLCGADRDRTAAGTSQDQRRQGGKGAGSVGPAAARRDLPVADPDHDVVHERGAGRRQRLLPAICAADAALCGRHGLHRGGDGEGAFGARPQDRGNDRSSDRPVQPARAFSKPPRNWSRPSANRVSR